MLNKIFDGIKKFSSLMKEEIKDNREKFLCETCLIDVDTCSVIKYREGHCDYYINKGHLNGHSK